MFYGPLGISIGQKSNSWDVAVAAILICLFMARKHYPILNDLNPIGSMGRTVHLAVHLP